MESIQRETNNISSTTVSVPTPAEIEHNNLMIEAKNKLQMALAFDMLRRDNNENTRKLFESITIEYDLMELDNHKAVEELLRVIDLIKNDIGALTLEHPEIIEHIAQGLTDDFKAPLGEIDLSELKKYLPKYFDVVH